MFNLRLPENNVYLTDYFWNHESCLSSRLNRFANKGSLKLRSNNITKQRNFNEQNEKKCATQK